MFAEAIRVVMRAEAIFSFWTNWRSTRLFVVLARKSIYPHKRYTLAIVQKLFDVFRLYSADTAGGYTSNLSASGGGGFSDVLQLLSELLLRVHFRNN